MLFKTKDAVSGKTLVRSKPLLISAADGWKEIPGFTNYQMSANGEIRRSLLKRVKGWHKPPGSLLKFSKHDRKDAYLVVRLKPDTGGKGIVCKIHQLVALTFRGPRPSLLHCALHKDDDRYNNHETNIYWGTKKQNAIDRSVNGRHGLAKLTEPEVLWIKELYFGDCRSANELSQIFNVRPGIIRAIVQGRSYKWVGWRNAVQTVP